MTLDAMFELLGEDNATIIVERYKCHQAGLNMARDVSHERTQYAGAIAANVTTRERGDIPNCTPPDNNQYLSFLDRMAKIEEANSAKKHKEEEPVEDVPVVEVDFKPFTNPEELICPKCGSKELSEDQTKLNIRGYKVFSDGKWWSQCLVCKANGVDDPWFGE